MASLYGLIWGCRFKIFQQKYEEQVQFIYKMTIIDLFEFTYIKKKA